MLSFSISAASAISCYFKRWRWATLFNGGALFGAGVARGFELVRLPLFETSLVLVGGAMSLLALFFGWRESRATESAGLGPAQRHFGGAIWFLIFACVAGAFLVVQFGLASPEHPA